MLLNSAWTEHSFIDNVGPIGGSNHKDHSSVVDPIQFIEQSIHYSLGHLVSLVLPFRGQGVKLIKKYYAWSWHSCSFKNLSHRLLALSYVLVQQLGAFDCDKVGVGLVSYGFGYHGLATTWRAIKQNPTPTHLEIHLLEFLLLPQRHNNLLSQFLFDIVQGSNIFKFNARNLRKSIFFQNGLHFFDSLSKIFNCYNSLAQLRSFPCNAFYKCLFE